MSSYSTVCQIASDIRLCHNTLNSNSDQLQSFKPSKNVKRFGCDEYYTVCLVCWFFVWFFLRLFFRIRFNMAINAAVECRTSPSPISPNIKQESRDDRAKDERLSPAHHTPTAPIAFSITNILSNNFGKQISWNNNEVISDKYNFALYAENGASPAKRSKIDRPQQSDDGKWIFLLDFSFNCILRLLLSLLQLSIFIELNWIQLCLATATYAVTLQDIADNPNRISVIISNIMKLFAASNQTDGFFLLHFEK